MRVTVKQKGHQPGLLTRSRQYAPQAARAIATMLSEADFADYAVVMLDWTGLIAFTDDRTGEVGNPLDRAKPVMYTQVYKALTQKGMTLAVENRIDIDDLMGGDNLEGTDLRNIVADLKDEVERQVALKAQED